MFLKRKNLKKILRCIGMELWENGTVGSYYHPKGDIQQRMIELEGKMSLLLKHLDLEYQEQCRESLPKLNKKK